MKTTLAYGERLAILIAVAVLVHLLSPIDWPWAIAIGAAAAVVLRALIHRQTATSRRVRPGAGMANERDRPRDPLAS